jgi:hypothetical protein
VKFGQTTPSRRLHPMCCPMSLAATAASGPVRPRYVAPQLGAGTPDLSHNGFQVTNDAGNLVDLNGNQINGAFWPIIPASPASGPINASQSLAYTADACSSPACPS